MKIRHYIADTVGLILLVLITLSPLGFYSTETDFGWFWNGIGGYNFSINGDSK